MAPVRPRMQAAGLQCLKLQIAVAFPDPQTRAFPGTELSRKTRSPKRPPRFATSALRNEVFRLPLSAQHRSSMCTNACAPLRQPYLHPDSREPCEKRSPRSREPYNLTPHNSSPPTLSHFPPSESPYEKRPPLLPRTL